MRALQTTRREEKNTGTHCGVETDVPFQINEMENAKRLKSQNDFQHTSQPNRGSKKKTHTKVQHSAVIAFGAAKE